MPYQFLVLFFLIILSAFFSASETALVAIHPSKIRELIAKKRKGAVSIEKLKNQPQKLLITLLIGNNIVNILATVYATVIFTEVFGSTGVGIAAGVMTFFLLIFGEIMPKILAHRFHVSFSLFFARLILLLETLFLPLIWFLEIIVAMFSKLVGDRATSYSLTEDELRAMVSLGAEQGSIEKQEQEFIENVLEFNDIQVEEVMTPRPDIQAFDVETTVNEAAKFMSKNTHSRIPVYDGTLDNIVGILSVKELLQQLAKENLDAPLNTIELFPVYHVPTTKKINQLFKEFQKKHLHMAIVVDEHGSVDGLVTLEDLLEEIVGEIVDEYDREEQLIKKIDSKTYLILGKTPIYDVAQILKIPFGNIPDYKPISFLILEHLRRFPKTGEVVRIGHCEFTVEKMIKKKIELLRATVKKYKEN